MTDGPDAGSGPDVTGGPDAGSDASGAGGGPAGAGSSFGWAFAVREVTEADLPRIVELEHELFGAGAWSAAMLREELSAPGRWYVAAVDVSTSRVEGYAGSWFDGDDAQVMTIGVANDRQRHGAASAMLAAMTERAVADGARRLLLEVRVDNAPAIAMYTAAGFVTLGRRRKYYQPEGIDAWTMSLDLRTVTSGPPGHTDSPTPQEAP